MGDLVQPFDRLVPVPFGSVERWTKGDTVANGTNDEAIVMNGPQGSAAIATRRSPSKPVVMNR